MTKSFNPARLTLARRRRGLTKQRLAQAVGLTARRLSAFENEGQIPPERTLRALTEILGFPLEFFSLDSPPTPTKGSVSFRSFSRLPACRRDAALAAAALAIELGAWIEARFDLPKPDLPDLRDAEGPRAAGAALRSMWGLGDQPAPNMIHLLEAHGVRVFSLAEDCAALDAYSLWYAERPHVLLTRHKTPERSRWDVAHELGHLVLHLGAPPQGQELEDQADEFAAEFLLPERGVMAATPWHPNLEQVCQHKLYWRVSALALIRAVHRYGMLTAWEYRSLVVEASQAGLRREESDIEREGSQVVPKVIALLRAEGVAPAHIASDLCISEEDLRGFLFPALTALSGDTMANAAPSRPVLRIVR